MTTPSHNISYQPTEGLSYDPGEPRYWDAAALKQELTRGFELCHGCRMCFKYCDSFPILFDLIDKKHDGDVTRITRPETDRVMAACFQCKLCEVQCPYTPREGHEFQFDFPKLIHRYKAQRAKARGIPLRDRILAKADTAGALARASFGLANVMNRVTLHRVFMQATLGIHKDKLLPDFAPTTFEKWAEAQGRVAPRPDGHEAVLFPTCYVQNNEPEIGRDTLDVLDRNQVKIACVKGLQCCGMPAWETGDIGSVRRQSSHNLKLLKPFVDAGAKVLEMVRTERMVKDADIRHEIETYNELLGGKGEPGSTLLVELDDPALRAEKLAQWLALPKHLYAKRADGSKAYARFDERQVGETRVSSVQYLKFEVGDTAPVAIGCDHPDPELRHETPLTAEERAALQRDLDE